MIIKHFLDIVFLFSSIYIEEARKKLSTFFFFSYALRKQKELEKIKKRKDNKNKQRNSMH